MDQGAGGEAHLAVDEPARFHLVVTPLGYNRVVNNDVGAWDYERWSAELDRRFLHEPENHPIMLCVDVETLTNLTGQNGEEAAVALARCVGSEVMPGYRFGRIAARCRRWAAGDRQSAPPSLPLLAATVLAASMMDRSVDMGAHNYYRRFRQLLDPSDDQSGMPGDYATFVPMLWRQLETWLNAEMRGNRGILTLPSDELLDRNPYRKNIGHALQQALFRASDRRRLVAFFNAVGLEPREEEIEAVELRRTLALWAGRRLPQAGRLYSLATAAEHETYCLQLLQRQAEGWDGRLDDPETGNPVSPIRLCLTTRPRSLGIVLPRDERMPLQTTIDWGGEAIELSCSASAPYFDPVPLPISISGELLTEDLTVVGPAIGAAHDASSIYALHHDEYLGAWVSTNSIAFGELHYLLAHDNALAKLIRFARSEGIAIAQVAGFADLVPPGWNVMSGFRVLRRPTSEPPSDVATLLRSGGGPRLRLVGGLKVPEFNRAYLTGGAPLLALPAGVQSQRIILQRASTDETITLRPESSEYPLDKLRLDEGLYHIQYGAARLAFDLIDGLVETAGDGAGSVSIPGRTTRLSGVHGCVPQALHPVTVTAPSEGEQCVLVGPGPNDLEIVELPVWLNDLVGGGGLSWRATAEWLSFEPVWRLTKLTPSAEHYEVERVGDTPPQSGPHSDEWAGLVRRAELTDADADTTALWRQYAAAAEQRP